VESYSIFKALADPTRRELLDMMRTGARTTGELAEAFEMTRFGVMKHLDVLQRAGLLVVRRSGRKRYNHLNAVPIQQIYQRWVGKYAGPAASSLLNLKELTETGDTPMSISRQPETAAIDSFHIEQEVNIAAPRTKVWDALTKNIGQWWAFRIADGEISLDAQLGGHFSERGEDGGAIWGTVTFIKKGERLTLNGCLGTSQKPIEAVYTYLLEDAGDGTLLKLSHRAIGQGLENMGDEYDEGWKQLLNTFLKPFVEEGKTCGDIQAAQQAD
jgi:DNA-binding transcriptional ArsR family regulator/uncharacterized protein YndB with AHSA1/START domain